jgi:hypothetical protein
MQDRFNVPLLILFKVSHIHYIKNYWAYKPGIYCVSEENEFEEMKGNVLDYVLFLPGTPCTPLTCGLGHIVIYCIWVMSFGRSVNRRAWLPKISLAPKFASTRASSI